MTSFAVSLFGADYDEAQAVLHRFFKMDVGKDYKVISFQGEPERIAALSNKDIQGAGLSIPHAVVATGGGSFPREENRRLVARLAWAPSTRA